MKYYVVLDTNVLVSALLKKGSKPWQIAEETLHGDIIPVIDRALGWSSIPTRNRRPIQF